MNDLKEEAINSWLVVLGCALIFMVTVTAILILSAPAPARADDAVVFRKPQGEHDAIYLTREACDIKVDMPVAQRLYRAYAVENEGMTTEAVYEGCWFSPLVDNKEIPQEYLSRVVPVVNIFTTQPGEHYTYLISDFVPVTGKPQHAGDF